MELFSTLLKFTQPASSLQVEFAAHTMAAVHVPQPSSLGIMQAVFALLCLASLIAQCVLSVTPLLQTAMVKWLHGVARVNWARRDAGQRPIVHHNILFSFLMLQTLLIELLCSSRHVAGDIQLVVTIGLCLHQS